MSETNTALTYPYIEEKAANQNVYDKTRRTILGTPIPSTQEIHQRLDKIHALAIFSSDALSSVAYGPEQILLALMMAGTSAMSLGFPITIVVVMLVFIVASSYRQTIHAYPGGGGSFIVARENLGIIPGLTAASALLIDYVLTVAVSVSAGISAVISVFPEMSEWRILFGLVCILMLVLANFRGLKDSGTIFALPTYVFMFSVFTMVIVGIIRIFLLGGHLAVQNVHPTLVMFEPLSLWLILRAFSSGCSTLTGTEALADGVPSFKPPEAKNAANTLTIMAGLLAAMSLGISYFAYLLHAVPSDTETILSQIGRTVFGANTVSYFVLQASTTLILFLAANTAFADFPRLSSILARNKFMPHQFAFRGDRLAFSNGILILGILAGLLVIIFGGSERHLIPLYAVGVFLSFTLSQSGMVCRFWKLRKSGWKRHIVISSVGAITTLVVLLIITSAKFTQGAWTVVLIIPIFVLIMRAIYRHYTDVEKQLHTLQHKPKYFHNKFIIPISKLDKHTLYAIDYARSITSLNNIIAVHVTEDRFQEKNILFQKQWDELVPDIPVTIVESPFRQLLKPLLTFIDNERKKFGEPITVVVADIRPVHWWEHALHTHISLRLKNALSSKPGIVIINTHYKIVKENDKSQ